MPLVLPFNLVVGSTGALVGYGDRSGFRGADQLAPSGAVEVGRVDEPSFMPVPGIYVAYAG